MPAERFAFSLPTRVVLGPGVIASVGEEARALGRRTLIVTGTAFARRSGLIDTISNALVDAGVSIILFDKIAPNPRVSWVDEGAALAREYGVDHVLGLGGGSTLDAAKAIALGAASGRSLADYLPDGTHEGAPIEGALPILQVPIIASTGSETNNAAVLLDDARQVKANLSSPHLQARVAIVDPTLTFSVPPRYTAVGGMNIVSQMLESYLTSDEFPVTDRIAEGLIRVVMDSLPRAMRRGEDLDARNNLSWVAALGPSFGLTDRAGFAPIRTLAQPLGAHYGVEHGMAVAALWPSYMRYALANRSRLPQIGRFKRYALLGRQIFGVHETDDEVAAEITSYRFVTWLRGLEMPTNLRDLGISDLEDTVSELAEQAITVSGTGGRLPGGLTANDVENIYMGALRGR